MPGCRTGGDGIEHVDEGSTKLKGRNADARDGGVFSKFCKDIVDSSESMKLEGPNRKSDGR